MMNLTLWQRTELKVMNTTNKNKNLKNQTIQQLDWTQKIKNFMPSFQKSSTSIAIHQSCKKHNLKILKLLEKNKNKNLYSIFKNKINFKA